MSDEIKNAVQQWLDFGDGCKDTEHGGYFSKGGWAYETLKSAPDEIERLRVENEQFRESMHAALVCVAALAHFPFDTPYCYRDACKNPADQEELAKAYKELHQWAGSP